jgi:predicted permease
MLKNYFITAFRSFRKNKIFSLINISGLAIGISAALVIYLLVQFEFSFDMFRKDSDRIYRVVTDITFPGDVKFKNCGVPMPMPKAVRSDLTGIETVTHFVTTSETKVTVPLTGSASPAEFKKQTEIVYADEFYFSMLEYDWLAGSKQTALKDPFQVVLTEERAKAYFGNLSPENIIGRTITYDDSIKTTVSGIIKDPLEKATDFRFKEFISLATVFTTGLKDQFGGDEWGNINSVSQMYVKLKQGVKPEQVNAQFAALRDKYRKKDKDDKDDTRNHLQALADIHFNADYDSGVRQAHKPTLYGLLAVAAFLLLLGCINFINLTTAQAAQRAKEIGIRKTLGSSKKSLIMQFLSETFLLTTLATVLSILITPWLLKVFSDFIPPEISFSSINQLHVWIFLALLIVLMTVFSGFYPALVLTKFKPVTVLKNQQNSNTAQSRKAWLRKTLTVTQFVIAQFLVIATLVVSKQINFSLNKDMGFKKDAIVTFRTPWDFYTDKEDNRRFTLVEKLKAIPGIEKISLGSTAPAHQGASSTTMKVNNGKKEIEMMVETISADTGYFDIYKMKLKAGRWMAQSDTTKEYLINESFCRALGFTDPNDAVGKFVERGDKKIPIVGVLADFNTKSTHSGIGPLAYAGDSKHSYQVNMALKPQDGVPGLWKATLEKAEKEFKALYPEDDFKYEFFDATIAAFYKKEQDISRLLNWAAGLCIFISSLGLLGLVIYTTNTRTKEIGVRKVLGASVVQIVSLLSKDLVSLVLIAFVIASPLAWWAMNTWLQDFVYRSPISWWVFGICGISMLLLAIIVLSIRTVKAALANPVKSLRTE